MRPPLARVLRATLAAAAIAAAGQAAAQEGSGGPVAVRLVVDAEPARAGETATLRLAISNADGRPVENLVTHHGRKVHLVLISEDMQVFAHIHPEDFGEPIAGGETAAHFEFPRPGRYLAAADLMTVAGASAASFIVPVEGDAGDASPTAAVPAGLVVVEAKEGDVYTAPVVFDAAGPTDGYEMSVSRPATIRAGEEVILTWRLTRDGEPITDLRPFLEAAMHLAVVKDDLGQFVHGHGIAKGIETGYDHVHGPGGVEAASDAPDLRYFGPEVSAAVTFPEPGRYYLFGQSVHGNALLVSRIPVDVTS